MKPSPRSTRRNRERANLRRRDPQDEGDDMKRFRRNIANLLVRLATRIDPGNEHAMKFYMDRMMDFIISGKSTIKVSVVDDADMLDKSKLKVK